MGVYRPMLVSGYECTAREDRLPRCLASARWAPPGYPSAWLHPCRARFCFTWRGHCSRVRRICKRRYCRPPELPLVTGFLDLAVARSVDLGLSPDEHIVRRHIADGAMQAYGVVVIHVGLNQAPRIFPRQLSAGSHALRLLRFCPQ